MQSSYNYNDVLFEFGIYGQELTFNSFINFVKREIAPYMEMELIVEDYLSELFEEFTSYQYTAEQIHRGAGKTEIGIWLTIFYAACQPLNPFSGKPIRQQLIITNSSETSQALNSRIKHYFYENPKLSLLVPDGAKKERKSNDYWSNSEMYTKNGSILFFRTINAPKSIRGNHVDRMWGDDLVGENSVLVDSSLEKNWFAAAHGTTTAKNALIDVTGTPQRYTDLMYKMRESEGYMFKARPIINKDGSILSNKRWDKKKIDAVKSTIGSTIFQCEYMLDPLDDKTSLIKACWVKQCFTKTLKMFNTMQMLRDYDNGLIMDEDMAMRPSWASRMFLGVDFAFSDRVTADKSSFAIIAEYKKEEKTYYVLYDLIEMKGKSALEQLSFIQRLHKYYGFDLIGLEENSIKAVSQHIKDYDMPIKRFWTGNNDEKEQYDQQWKEYKTVGKRNLITRLGVTLENKNILIPYGDEYSKNKGNDFLNECVSFAQEEGKLVEIGVHPDHPIAVGYALEVCKQFGEDFLLI